MAGPPAQCHLLRHVQQLVKVHTSVGELPEGTLLLDLCVRLKQTSITPASVAKQISIHHWTGINILQIYHYSS